MNKLICLKKILDLIIIIKLLLYVVPAKAGTQFISLYWIPVFTGMTIFKYCFITSP